MAARLVSIILIAFLSGGTDTSLSAQDDFFSLFAQPIVDPQGELDRLAEKESKTSELDVSDILKRASCLNKLDDVQGSLDNCLIAKSKLGKDSTSVNFAYVLDQIGYLYYDLGDIEKSTSHHLKAKQILEELETKDKKLTSHRALVYYHLARSYTGSASTYKSCISAADSSILLYQQILNPPSEIVRAYMVKGVALEGMDKLNPAHQAYNKALELSTEYPEDQKVLINIYKNLGNLYLNMDDDPRALVQYNKALDLSLEVNGRDTYQTNSILNNIAYVKGGLKQFDESISIYKELLRSNIKLYGENDVEVARVYQNIGNTYSRNDDQINAVENFVRAEKIYTTILPPESIDLAINHLHLGEAYQLAKSHEEALGQYKKTHDIAIKVLGEDHIIIAACKYYSANVNADMGNYDVAFRLYNETKKLLGYDENDLSRLKSYTKAAELHFNIGNSYSYWYEDAGADSLLLLSQMNYHEGMRLIDLAKNQFESRNSNEFLISRYRATYENYLLNEFRINKAGLVDNTELFFSFIDDIKNSQLKDAVLQNKAIDYANIPEEMIQKEFSLSELIHNDQQEVEYLETFGLDSIEVLTKAQNSLASHSAQYDELLDAFEKNYPTFYNFKLSNEGLDMGHLKNNLLDKNEVVINFFTEKDYIFSATLGQDFYSIDSVHLTTELKSKIENYTADLQNHQSNGWIENSFYLYDKLLEDIINKLPSSVHTLTIQPDGILCDFPFETLNYNEHTSSFLLDTYNIKYRYNSQSMINPHRDPITNGKILAMAPAYEDSPLNESEIEDFLIAQLIRDGQYNLPGSIEEVNAIGDLFNSKLLKGKEATKENFTQLAGEYDVLHLSMHALVDKQSPLQSKLLFASDESKESNGYLHAYELYSMEIPAELVVLSACNTGVGKAKHGEGIMSLNRAFTYAGVSSSIMSLWQVPDEATTKIMTAFYQGISEGLTKSQALQSAKKIYIESEVINELKHPYYWSGFVFIGEDGAMDLEESSNYTLWLICVLILISGMVLYFKKN